MVSVKSEQTNKKKTLWSRKIGIATILVISVYTLGGFFLAPHYIKNQMIDALAEKYAWKATIEKLRINPYTFTIAIEGFAVYDSRNVKFFGFREFFSNYQPLALIRGRWNFKTVLLSQPNLKIQVEKDGSLNINKLLTKDSTNPQAKNKEKKRLLIFDSISIESGNFMFIDLSKPKLFKMVINPIDITLENLNTLGNEKGKYRVECHTMKNESIFWNGTIGFHPLQFTGNLRVTNFGAQRFWDYFPEMFHHHVTNGNVDLAFSCQIETKKNTLLWTIQNAELALRDFSLSSLEENQEILSLSSLSIKETNINGVEGSVHIGSVGLSGLTVNTRKNKEGNIMWFHPIQQRSDHQKKKSYSSRDKDSKWETFVKEIRIAQSSLVFEDQSLSEPQFFNVENIDLKLENISSSPNSTSDFDLQCLFNSQCEVSIQGNGKRIPIQGQAKVKISEFPLSVFQTYLDRFVNLTIDSGAIDIDGEMNFHQKKPRDWFGFSGSAQISEFSAIESNSGKQIFGWKNLSGEQMELKLGPTVMEIPKLDWLAPFAKIVIDEDSQSNFSQLLQLDQGNDAPKRTNVHPKTLPEGNGNSWKLTMLNIQDGIFEFSDESLPIKFHTVLAGLEGKVSNLSAFPEELSSVDLRGKIDQNGTASITGTINPISPSNHTSLALDIKNIEVANLTPYSAKYAGQGMDQGNLSLVLHYSLEERKLINENNIQLDQFILGEKIESQDAVKLPYTLAVALLKDRHGRIEVDLPVRGELDDPEFSYGKIIGKALVNLLTKVVTSPFSSLGNLVGADGEEFLFIEFDANDSSCLPEEKEKLSKLAEALKLRPNLHLEIQPSYDEGIDGNAIRNHKLQRLIEAELSKKMSKQSHSKTVSLTDLLKALKKLYVRQFSKKKLSKLKNELITSTSSNTGSTDAPVNFSHDEMGMEELKKALEQQMMNAQSVEQKEFTELANARAETIKTLLVKNFEIPDHAFSILEPISLQNSESKLVRCNLSLKF